MASVQALGRKLNGQYILNRVSLIVISGLLLAYTVSVTRQQNIKFPSLNHQSKLNSLVPNRQKSTPGIANHGQNPWIYNFADYPNGALSSDYWNFTTGAKDADYNNEAETYTSSQNNARIQDGVLVIEALPHKLNGKDYTSARVNTKDKFDFTYGTLEVNMMMPAGSGTWPAAWLLPVNNTYKTSSYGLAANDKYAWALNGEIDFAEAIGSLPGQNIPAAHSYDEVQAAPTYTPAYISNPYTEFHRYGVIKTPDRITFTIDGQPYATRQKTSNNPLDWPYDQPYYLILNLAVGGNWAGANGIDNSTAPWQLKIRSVTYSPL
jgi:beta-glucanase (GH16 family)